MKIAVIGSGPSGLATIFALLENSNSGDEIFLVHGNLRWSSSDEIKSARKQKFGSSYMFSRPLQLQVQGSKTNFSLGNGGLSAIWGAGLRLWDEIDISKLGAEPKKVYDSAKKLLEFIPYTGGNTELNLPREWTIENNRSIESANNFEKLYRRKKIDLKCEVVKPSLSVYTIGQKSCQNCGLCLSGCPYGSIFDSGDTLDSLIIHKRINSIPGVVSKILPNSTGIQLIIDEEPNLRIEEFDRVYISAGAIGTPLLLLNSDLVSTSLHIKDSQVFNFFGVRRPQNNTRQDFPLGQAIIKSTIQSSIPFSVTLFQLNKDLLSNMTSGMNPILKNLIKHLGYFSKFVFVGIGFLDSSDSNQLEINSVDKSVKSRRTQGRFMQFLKVFRISLKCNQQILRNGLFLIPLIQTISKPGLGYHSGGALPLGSELVDDVGRLRSEPRIYISDTSLLRFIKPGAHTFMTMSLIHSIHRNLNYENIDIRS
jgi:ferredoxin